MMDLTIRNLDEFTLAQLRLRARQHGRSEEEEARLILTTALEPEVNLAEAVRKRVESHGGIDLEMPLRDATRTPPDLS